MNNAALQMLFAPPMANLEVARALQEIFKPRPKSMSFPFEDDGETFEQLLSKSQHGRSSASVDPDFKPIPPVYGRGQ